MQLVSMNGNQPTTTSMIVAEGTESQHASVIRLVRDNLSDFEEFGRVGFEIASFETAGGTQKRTIAILNREHAMLLMTYMRNTAIVRDFKKRLIKAFVELENRAQNPGVELTRMELIQIALNAETERIELEAKNEKLKEFQRNIYAGNGITLTDFSKKYFGDVPARKFFQHLYDNNYLIDQRGGAHTKYGSRHHGPSHGKPTAKGRHWLYSHDHGEYGGKRRLRTRVRPERELALRDQLMDDGLPINANALTASGHFSAQSTLPI